MKTRMYFASTIYLLCGTYYVVAGGLLFFVPRVFFERLFPVGSFNQHYMIDLGSFLLPLGVALILAACRSGQCTGVITIAAAASALHLISHLREGFHSGRDRVTDISLALVTLGLFAALFLSRLKRHPQNGEVS
ncbi:MAG TPA: hypothetical protein VFA71_08930 [Terriglobales bacterium]|nr:hypothetical protein [Terriglobales bacterium]